LAQAIVAQLHLCASLYTLRFAGILPYHRATVPVSPGNGEAERQQQC